MRSSIVNEAAEDTVRASQILGTVRVAETPGEAPVVKEAARKMVEALERPEQLNEIVQFRKLLRQFLNSNS